MIINNLEGGIEKTIASSGIGETIDTIVEVIGFFASVMIAVSVFIQAKIGKSRHSPQWSTSVWSDSYEHAKTHEPQETDTVVLELDEMWHYLKK